MTTATAMRTETYTIPSGAYMIGCPMLLTTPNDEDINDLLFEPGVGEIDGHKFFTICTGGDGCFSLYDTEEDNEEVDAFGTDVATISIIPLELIPDLEAAAEYGRHFEVGETIVDGIDEESGDVTFHYLTGDDDPGIEITVHYHRFDNGNEAVHHVDIEWYKLSVAEQWLAAFNE